MSETWLASGLRMIEAIDKGLPADMPLADRKREIQKEAWRFHGGTSWGQKVWPKAKRIYFAKKYGDKPTGKAGVPDGYLSPLERLWFGWGGFSRGHIADAGNMVTAGTN